MQSMHVILMKVHLDFLKTQHSYLEACVIGSDFFSHRYYGGIFRLIILAHGFLISSFLLYLR